jgi:hypothetical protein
MSVKDRLAFGASLEVGTGDGAVCRGMTVMESSRTGELLDSDCMLRSLLLNNREDLMVRLALMNSFS